jgi:hypothetical protein
MPLRYGNATVYASTDIVSAQNLYLKFFGEIMKKKCNVFEYSASITAMLLMLHGIFVGCSKEPL